MKCDCWYHRYHVVHCIPESEKVFDHSQGTWDDKLRSQPEIETYPSELYQHEMTASELREAYRQYVKDKR